MGELFANFEEYDVQATRRDEREKTEKEVTERLTGQAIEKVIKIVKDLGNTEEIAKIQLMKEYDLTKEEAEKKIAMYW